MAQFSAEEMAHAVAVLERVRPEWLQRPGVTAVDLGYQWRKGRMTRRLSIRVHVERKKRASELTEAERFPQEIEGLPVDIIEASYGVQQQANWVSQLETAADERGKPFTEIPLGVSIGSPYVSAGTLGAKVIDIATGKEMILSNWHVMVGAQGEQSNLPILQPGPADGGDSRSAIALLKRSLLGPYDAAVARLIGSRPVLSQTLEGHKIERSTAPQLGMSVWKSGRTTGRTEGIVDGLKMVVPLQYPEQGSFEMRDVIRIVPLPGQGHVELSTGGDSGAIWVDAESGHAVGLHFAGELGNLPEHALAHELTAVMAALQVRLPGENSPDQGRRRSPDWRDELWRRLRNWIRNRPAAV